MKDAPRPLERAALDAWALWLQQSQRFVEAEQFLDAVRRATRAREALEAALAQADADPSLREEAQMLLARARRVEREAIRGHAAWSKRLNALHEQRLDPAYQAEVVSRPLPKGLPG